MTNLSQGLRRLRGRSKLLRDGWHLVTAVRMESRGRHSTFQTIRSLLAEQECPAFTRALHWVQRNELETGGIRVHTRHRAAYAEVTGYFMPTLLAYGEAELAARCARWLISVQAADGSYADPDRGLPYIFDTGQVLRGLVATIDIIPEAAAAARRAADYLCQQAVDGGRAGFDVRFHNNTDPQSLHLYVLPPLIQAADVFGEPRYAEIAERCLEHYVCRPDALRIETLTHFLGYEIEALIDLGHNDLALPVLNQLRRLQGNDGSLRGEGGQEWVCTPGLAQMAVCWYKTGQRQPADNALAWIEKRQLWCGGFYGSYGPRAAYFPDVVPAWAVKFYLDAHRLRLLSSLRDAKPIQSRPPSQG